MDLRGIEPRRARCKQVSLTIILVILLKMTINLNELRKEIQKLKNSNQRFSAVIRYLIKKYNEQREPKIMEEIKLRKEGSS